MSLEEPYLEVTFTVIDPDYLTEPLVRSATYMRAPTLQLPPYPCQPEEYQPGEKYRVPHYLPGENPYLTESGFKYKAPQEGVRGGADTLYPEWRARGVTLAPPATQSTIKPVYTDASSSAPGKFRARASSAIWRQKPGPAALLKRPWICGASSPLHLAPR